MGASGDVNYSVPLGDVQLVAIDTADERLVRHQPAAVPRMQLECAGLGRAVPVS